MGGFGGVSGLAKASPTRFVGKVRDERERGQEEEGRDRALLTDL